MIRRYAATCSHLNLRIHLHLKQQMKIQRHGKDFTSVTPPANSSRFRSSLLVRADFFKNSSIENVRALLILLVGGCLVAENAH